MHLKVGNEPQSDFLQMLARLPVIRQLKDRWIAQRQGLCQAERDRLALLMSAMREGVFDIDLAGGEHYFSQRAHDLLGFEPGRINGNGARYFPMLPPSDEQNFELALNHALEERAPRFDVEVRMRHASGHLIPVSVRSSIVYGEDGKPVRLVGCLDDAPAPHSDNTRDGFFDYLTGLPNRALVCDRLEQRVRQLRRDQNAVFAVFFVDIDDFKTVNDSLGHAVGDQILVAVTRRLEQVVRGSDTIGRLGGDEFVLVVDGAAGLKDVDVVISRINEAMSEPVQVSNELIRLCCSVGVVIAHEAVARPNDLLRDADVALYEAKKTGRGRSVVFNEAMGAAVSYRRMLERDLHHALTANEFELFYQPIIATHDCSLYGFEALIRWRHPERGLIYPAEFIPLAEETGLILPIGQWAIGEAIRQLAEWNMADLSVSSVAVNVSPVQFEQASSLVQVVAESLCHWNVPPKCLKLEVTESLVSSNPEGAAETLKLLSAMGVRLAIDDFGTGHSSLSRLLDMPFDTVKIDRAFVARIEREPRSCQIIEGINDIARRLGMDVVAEGVETTREYSVIAKIGCQYSQGFLFAKPMPAEDATRLLRDRKDQPSMCSSPAFISQEPVK